MLFVTVFCYNPLSLFFWLSHLFPSQQSPVPICINAAQCWFCAGDDRDAARCTNWGFEIKQLVEDCPSLKLYQTSLDLNDSKANQTFCLPKQFSGSCSELFNQRKRLNEYVCSHYSCDTEFLCIPPHDFWCLSRAQGRPWPHSERLQWHGIITRMTFCNFVKAVLITHTFSMLRLV